MILESLNADWAMVGITIVYVIATIILCAINWHSNNLTKKQTEDSNKQYEERKRLEIMPYFTLECKEYHNPFYCPNFIVIYDKFAYEWCNMREFTVVVENIGLGPAKNLEYFFAFDTDEISFDIYPRRGESVPATFNVGEKKEFGYHVTTPGWGEFIKYDIRNLKLIVGITYEDLLSNKYSQQVEIDYDLEKAETSLCMKSWTVIKQKRIFETPEQNT